MYAEVCAYEHYVRNVEGQIEYIIHLVALHILDIACIYGVGFDFVTFLPTGSICVDVFCGSYPCRLCIINGVNHVGVICQQTHPVIRVSVVYAFSDMKLVVGSVIGNAACI